MNPLSSINNQVNTNSMLSDAYGINSGQAEVGESASLSGAAATPKAQVSETSSDGHESLALSSRAVRAQKIEAMANDFFADGQFGSAKLPSLIQRLYRDDILSEGQLNRLSNSGFNIPQGQTQDLASFIDEKRKSLSDSDADVVQAKMLDEAEFVMGAMDNVQSPVNAQKATRVSAQLTQLLSIEQPMSDTDRLQYEGLKSLMQLASSMGEHQQAGGQLNSYLALANRH